MPRRYSNKLIKKLCPQKHHIVYEHDGHSEETVWLLRGEHWIITKLDRKFRLSKHKPFTEGFLKALGSFYNLYGNKAIKLEDYLEKDGREEDV